MSQATAGYYRSGATWLHRRNPVTKLLWLLLVLLAIFLLPPVTLAVMAGLLAIVAASAGLATQLVRSFRIPAILIGSILIVNALFFPGASQVVVPLGPVGLSVEGLTFGVITAGRVVVAFMASILFLFTTLADDLLEALVARGVSHRLAFVVLSAVQLIPRLQARAGAIQDAQQARGLRVQGSLLTRIRALVPLVGPMVLGSLIDVRERTFALEARAFGAIRRRTAYRLVADPPIDRWLRLVTLVAMAAVVVVAATGVIRFAG
jgi:energy-coupling factor transport system permease protein